MSNCCKKDGQDNQEALSCVESERTGVRQRFVDGGLQLLEHRPTKHFPVVLTEEENLLFVRRTLGDVEVGLDEEDVPKSERSGEHSSRENDAP